MRPVMIDLSKGWNSQEVNKLISLLPCPEIDKKVMRLQNKTIEIIASELLAEKEK